MNETLEWKGLRFIAKPFTLDSWYAFAEAAAELQESGRLLRGTFEAGCKTLLAGETNEAQGFINSGELAKAVLTSENVESAMAFKGRVDFLLQAFTLRGNALMKSAPDLNDKLAAKVQKASTPKSQKVTKGGQGHSG